ncbi:hypothetical protein Y032_0002g946 [Ancylostoma ceylanicum]|nr:hypothetical protein Y032_0002g946 [Ancylostoma ceylanicum]
MCSILPICSVFVSCINLIRKLNIKAMRHETLNEKKANPSRSRERVRLSCHCDAAGPILHHTGARASVTRIHYKLPLTPLVKPHQN